MKEYRAKDIYRDYQTNPLPHSDSGLTTSQTESLCRSFLELCGVVWHAGAYPLLLKFGAHSWRSLSLIIRRGHRMKYEDVMSPTVRMLGWQR